MNERFKRTEMLFGTDAMERLKNCRVAVFGIGGVGGHTAEALVRSGIGKIHIIDNDTVSITNINRQIIATTSTVGRYKVDVMRERLLDINPELEIETSKTFFLPETADEFDFTRYDYIVDAIDTVTGKIALIEKAKKENVPIISSMGTGNKLDPTRLEIDYLEKTSVCPLARVMRLEMKKRGIKKVKVLYSKEEAIKPVITSNEETTKRQIPGSTSFVPSCAGLIIAGEILKELAKNQALL